MKKPFIHALGAALYIVVVVFVMDTFGSFFEDKEETIIIPMTMLSLFVLSTAVMGFFFVSESMALLFEGKKKEAIIFFGKVLGFFACFVLVFLVLNFLT